MTTTTPKANSSERFGVISVLGTDSSLKLFYTLTQYQALPVRGKAPSARISQKSTTLATSPSATASANMCANILTTHYQHASTTSFPIKDFLALWNLIRFWIKVFPSLWGK